MATRKKKRINAKTYVDTVHVKLTPADRKAIRANAKLFAKGNISAWMRHAAMRYIPKRGEHIEKKVA